MTVSVTRVEPSHQSIGSLHAEVIDLALAANDYVTGGIAISSYISGTAIGALVLAQTQATPVGYSVVFDEADSKVMLFEQTDPAAAGGANTALVEVTNGSSSAITLRLLVFWA